jgi:RNA polymerase sigma-70 factor, ECF subfamily
MSIELPAEELLARVVEQDVAALSELYDRYAPRVYGLMARILASREEAEDVLPEVFVRLRSESASLAGEAGSVAAWLVLTARAVAVDRLRTQRKNVPGPAAEGPSASAAKGSNAGAGKSRHAAPPSVEKPVEGKPAAKSRAANAARTSAAVSLPSGCLPRPKEIDLIDNRLTLLHKVLDQLPQAQREALELAVFGGLSESEIAAVTGEPLGKVQRSLRAAVTFVKHRRRAVCGTWAANI